MIATRTIFEGLKYSPVLMNCLLPKYKNDIKLYERMVVVVPAFTERTFRQIKFVNVPYTRNNNGPVPNFPPGQTKRYVNILFQTEAIDSYHDKCERASTLSEYTSVPWWTRNVGLDPSTWFPNLTTKFLSWLGNPEAKKLIADKERGKRLFDDSVELQTFRDTANVSNPYYWRGFIYSLAFRVVRPVSYSCQNFEDLLRMSMTGEQLKATLGSNGFVEYSFFPGFVVIQGSLTPTIGLSGPDLRWATNTINTTDSPGPSPYSHSYFKNLIVNALVELGYQNPCP
jgi:hypothetical protein